MCSRRSRTRWSVKVPQDRAIDGVNQLPFFEGRQRKSNRESFLYFAPNGQVRAVKWRDWKLHYVWQDEPGQPVERTMKLFNLRSDPKEETDIKDANPWVPTAIGKIVSGFLGDGGQVPADPRWDARSVPAARAAQSDDRRPAIGETVTTASGLSYVFTKQGTGTRPQPGDLLVIHGIGRFPDGKEFWNTRTEGPPYEYTPGVDRVIRGFEEGMRDVREGDRIVITMKPELAYGERGNRDIPPNATLVFDYEILAVESLSIARLLRDGMEAGTLDTALTRARGLSNLREHYVSATSIRSLASSANRRKAGDGEKVLIFGLTLLPDAYMLHQALAREQSQRGAAGDAIRSYEAALRLNPKKTDAERRDHEAATKALADLRAQQPVPQAADDSRSRVRRWCAGSDHLPKRPADGAQVFDLHLLVLARHDDAVRAGGERVDGRLVNGFGIVGWAAGHVEADARVDLRLAVRARDAALRLTQDVVGRQAALAQLARARVRPVCRSRTGRSRARATSPAKSRRGSISGSAADTSCGYEARARCDTR